VHDNKPIALFYIFSAVNHSHFHTRREAGKATREDPREVVSALAPRVPGARNERRGWGVVTP